MDMIERVARAICASEPAIEEIHSFEFHKAAYIAAARAVVEAMREPTDAMVDNGLDAPNDFQHGRKTVLEIYEAMINAALKPEPVDA